MFTISICSNFEDVYYEFKKTIQFEDLMAAVDWMVEFLGKDPQEYEPYCFKIVKEKECWFKGLDEDDYEEFYLTATLADESGYAGGYMSENAIVNAQLPYVENRFSKIKFYAPWSVFSCDFEENNDRYRVFEMLQQRNHTAKFYD